MPESFNNPKPKPATEGMTNEMITKEAKINLSVKGAMRIGIERAFAS